MPSDKIEPISPVPRTPRDLPKKAPDHQPTKKDQQPGEKSDFERILEEETKKNNKEKK